MKKKTLWISFSILAALVLLFFAGRYFIYSKVQGVIAEKIEALRSDGIHITYDSLKVDPWSGHLFATNIHVAAGADSAHTYMDVKTDTLEVKGVGLLPLLLRKSLEITSIRVASPVIVISKLYAGPPKSKEEKGKKGIPLKHIGLEAFDVTNASVFFKDSTEADTLATSMHASLQITDVDTDIENDSLRFQQAAFTITALDLRTPKSFYSYTIQQLQADLQEKTMTMDSLRVIPMYDRTVFMRKSGEQTSRIEALVPVLSLQGVQIGSDSGLQFTASRSELRFNIQVYRDKRYAFMKKTHSEMPMEFLQKLPFLLNIDTIKIKESYVKYEEFPEKGDSIGYVFFDRLNATIAHLHNRAVARQDVTMRTTALFMGKGKLDATFTFPSDTTQAYRTHGSLKDFPLAEVNKIIEPSFQTRIEKGMMSDFSFDFIYNKLRSDGGVVMTYNDVKVLSMKRDKNNKKIISKFKTAVINLLVIGRNSEQTENGEKKNGTILYYRDSRRAIFHFWWKSLFSGIVTAYKLDGLVPDKKDHGRDISKETKDKIK